MNKELTIIELTATLVRITCKGGRVRDTRNGREYSEVEDLKENVAYYEGV